MKRLLSFARAVTCAAVLFVAGWSGYELWDFSRPAVSARKLARLNSHMDTNRVAMLLGAPTSSDVFTNDHGQVRTTWTYARESGWKFVDICFGADGKFERYYED